MRFVPVVDIDADPDAVGADLDEICRTAGFFQNANWSAEISCLPSCLAPGERPRYEPVLAGPYLMSKFRRSVTTTTDVPIDHR